jgi:SAM-dependent methyltransferase
MNDMETKHVYQSYAKIAEHFDVTRFNHWNFVASFLSSLPTYSLVFDSGCGNGKYLHFREDLLIFGNDTCEELLHISKEKTGAPLVYADGRHLPYKDASFDAAISIAVLHHIATHADRIRFLTEMARCLRINSLCCITVWAMEQEKMKVFSKWKSLGKNDFLIPWHDTYGKLITYRYYHLFDQQEIEALCGEIPNLKILKVVYEKSNWCVLMQKIDHKKIATLIL